MEVDISKVQDVVERFKDANTHAPREVAQALAALIGDAEVSHSVAVYEIEGDRVTWECMAVAGGAVVHVSASRVGGEWYADDFDAGGEAPIVHGHFIPLDEVASVRLLELKSSSTTRWLSRWQLQLRNGDPQVIPWPRHADGQEQHERLARAVADQLT